LVTFCSYYDGCGVCEGNGQSCCTCDDSDHCTVDTCSITDKSKCKFTAMNCDDLNSCTNDYCTAGICHNDIIPCSSSNVCFNCSAGACTPLPNPCNDNDPCTLDQCDNTNGCSNPPNTCDDGDDCTTDTCVAGVGCQHAPINCDTGLFCQDHVCVHGVGCTNFTKTCVVSDADCYVGVCSESARSCAKQKRSKANPVTCNKKAKAAVITGGIIAGIVIGAVIFLVLASVAGKKSFDFYMNSRSADDPIKTNPLYEENKNQGVNPFHVDKTVS